MAAIVSKNNNPLQWSTLILCAIGFWISGSLVLDLIIMPGLYSAGMMNQPGFASAGFSIFWAFNRLELLCASVALTGILVLNQAQTETMRPPRLAMILGLILLGIALIDTYGLTPQMSALGLNLNLFEPTAEIPSEMIQMQSGYWALEFMKIATCGAILKLCYGDRGSAQ
ncbi:DUF4149 domain-containing protein [Desertifilum sp. FACHB-1129]|uniref:Uncharacterized protein n=2 Tax=Desertifilum tharense IPPAS B-1220 TaxID=1781255 RepID=A0A1E5QRV3_9CYAN|nr:MULTISPECIES: DUF4149 domain-containing protein [Desertifilum]MDA0210770.1 DUF4149 domain-containing protein [Cyanobacteria bacterium FC1]MBD2312256.1 DUF4149 domain-containing protein [Desertifilum sp. FACHB-1129]MBD2323677.1 DUF4149 domain-containing protein [Desertifilum sp. FACHB-866]MBD2332374.1 DUF4149 domain-containing protein [Desertifilum sp. FACHB-868]OEJ77063.1 hypothetical protein BH720_01125 [Desertifilum tharense IPPAS B-1220]